MESFERIARNSIAQHQAEIARLERALAAYLGTKSYASHAHKIYRKHQTGLRKVRTSKYEALFRIYAEQERPLSHDDMLQIAANHGYFIDRNNMRSIVYTQKQHGRTTENENGYIWSVDSSTNTIEAAEEIS